MRAPGGQTAEKLAARLVDELRARGCITRPEWERALHEVPRHLFAPLAAWFVPNHADAPGGRIDAVADPVAWREAVYSDTSIVIQADDGASDPTKGEGVYTSSVSAPGIVFPFLELLNPQPGDRVLGIGTGSGWTAAMLSWRVGQDGVTSIEVDPHIAAQASANLRKTNLRPHLIVGDGTKGWPERAPFDRVHVTAGVSRIPMTWIEQTRPGGVVVLPWHAGGRMGHRLRLTVVNKTTAVGRFHGPASFMMLRDQRYNTTWNAHHDKDADRTTTRLDPHKVIDADLGAYLVSAALAPRVGWHVKRALEGTSLLLFEMDNVDGSWAGCYRQPGDDEYEVLQYGERRLWDEVSAAYLQWIALGSPAYERFGLTVHAGSAHLWLDHPGGPSWQIP